MFQFKQFSVEDAHSSMKVGTDAVLLGCLTPANTIRPINILDIGTGCGIVALILAQRIPTAMIDAIDIDTESIQEAADNFHTSPWHSRLTALHTSLQDYTSLSPKTYDLIVSNPPFFVDSLKGYNAQRNRARHNDTLPLNTLITSIAQMLSPQGIFCCILPCPQAELMISDANIRFKLQCTSHISIRNFPNSPFKRTIFTLQFGDHTTINKRTLNLRNPDNSYSAMHRELTKDFYLAL